MADNRISSNSSLPAAGDNAKQQPQLQQYTYNDPETSQVITADAQMLEDASALLMLSGAALGSFYLPTTQPQGQNVHNTPSGSQPAPQNSTQHNLHNSQARGHRAQPAPASAAPLISSYKQEVTDLPAPQFMRHMKSPQAFPHKEPSAAAVVPPLVPQIPSGVYHFNRYTQQHTQGSEEPRNDRDDRNDSTGATVAKSNTYNHRLPSISSLNNPAPDSPVSKTIPAKLPFREEKHILKPIHVIHVSDIIDTPVSDTANGVPRLHGNADSAPQTRQPSEYKPVSTLHSHRADISDLLSGPSNPAEESEYIKQRESLQKADEDALLLAQAQAQALAAEEERIKQENFRKEEEERRMEENSTKTGISDTINAVQTEAATPISPENAADALNDSTDETTDEIMIEPINIAEGAKEVSGIVVREVDEETAGIAKILSTDLSNKDTTNEAHNDTLVSDSIVKHSTPPLKSEDSTMSSVIPNGGTEAEVKTETKPMKAELVGPPSKPAAKVEQFAEDAGVIKCICGFDHDDGFTIQCESCNRWEHAICVGIKSINDAPDEYFCEKCAPRELDVNRAVELQKQQLEKAAGSKRKQRSQRSSRTPTGDSRLSSDIEDTKKTRSAQSTRDMSPSETSQSVTSSGSAFTVSSNVSTSSTKKSSRIKANQMEALKSAEESSETPDHSVEQKSIAPYQHSYRPIRANLYAFDISSEEVGFMAKQVLSQPVKPEGFVRMKPSEFSRLDKAKAIVKQFPHSQKQRFNGIEKYGLFADQTLGKDKFVIECLGKLERFETYKSNPINQYRLVASLKSHVFPVPGLALVLDARGCGNEGRFLRRSCEPTCQLRTVVSSNTVHLCLYTLKPVKNGTELTLPWQFDSVHPVSELLQKGVTAQALDQLNEAEKVEVVKLINTVYHAGECGCGNGNTNDCRMSKLKRFAVNYVNHLSSSKYDESKQLNKKITSKRSQSTLNLINMGLDPSVHLPIRSLLKKATETSRAQFGFSDPPVVKPDDEEVVTPDAEIVPEVRISATSDELTPLKKQLLIRAKKRRISTEFKKELGNADSVKQVSLNDSAQLPPLPIKSSVYFSRRDKDPHRVFSRSSSEVKPVKKFSFADYKKKQKPDKLEY